MGKALVGVALALWLAPAAHAAAAPTRILYASDWSGAMEIYAVDPARKTPPAELTFGGGGRPCTSLWTPCGFVDPRPSPNGHDLLYRHTDGSLWLARADGASPRELSGARGRADWSRDSRWVAYTTSDGIHVVGADGAGDRLVRGSGDDVLWSADGKGFLVREGDDLYEVRGGRERLVATSLSGAIVASPNRRWLMTVKAGQPGELIDLRARPIRRLIVLDLPVAAAWTRDSSRVAWISTTGLWIRNFRTGRTRMLASAATVGYRWKQEIGSAALGLGWAPDGKSVAYIPGGTSPGFGGGIESGDLRVLSLSGRQRTIVSTEHAYGGRMLSLAWSPAARGLRYRGPEEKGPNRASADSVLTEGGVSDLATDGERVAFVSCNGVYVWDPHHAQVTTVTHDECEFKTNYGLYDVAVAGSRVIYATSTGCNIISQSLFFKALDATAPPRSIATGSGNCGAPYHPAVGELQGDGDLLVFSSWQERSEYVPPRTRFVTTQQAIQRVGADGCPCAVVATSGGPLIPADVDDGRIVAFGEKATLLLDANGKELLSIPVSPTAAQLSGDDLFLLRRGELRRYDARDGSFQKAWPLPEVPSGRGCYPRCLDDELVLQDARQGLVAYTLNGEIHLLRLSDGADNVFAPGRLARFTNDGLVYVKGARIRLVPWSRLG